MPLNVYRELNSNLVQIGTLWEDESFSYSKSYLDSNNSVAISFSLPLSEKVFTPQETAPYFRGLLPEGRSISSLAARLGRLKDNYFGILKDCGLDCVGDIIIKPEAYTGKFGYNKTSLEELNNSFKTNYNVYECGDDLLPFTQMTTF